MPLLLFLGMAENRARSSTRLGTRRRWFFRLLNDLDARKSADIPVGGAETSAVVTEPPDSIGTITQTDTRQVSECLRPRNHNHLI